MPENLPYVPEFITVHLGAPGEDAPNVTVRFADYIANVASSEVYPTWPESALRANIYAQISYALNRIYTEYYRSRGYDFDITNSTTIDQSFVNGRDIYENVQDIVNEIFNEYIRRQGNVEPLFAQYCDGIEVVFPGLSQWGSLELANMGYSPYDILTYYYGDDIEIVPNAPVRGIDASVPRYPLQLGSAGDDVRSIQIRLNRSSNNYPAIPKINPPYGSFSTDTEQAVKKFQEIFGLTPDGIVGKATWYKIQNIYNSVKRLNAINSEGITLEEVSKQYPELLAENSRGLGVSTLQYYLSYLSDFYDTIPPVEIDGVFGPSTKNAVIAAQNEFGLPPDGIVCEDTWQAIYNAYIGIVRTIPVEYYEGNTIPFPGVILNIGSESEAVRVLQEYLNYISDFYPEIPPVNPTGYFGERTQEAVLAFQEYFGLLQSGTVGPITWDSIANVYGDLYNSSRLQDGQHPGYDIGG